MTLINGRHSSIAVGPRIDALRPLEELIPGVLAASKAPSTVKGYHSQFQKWKAWAPSFPGVVCFPASALHFSLYLISLVQSGSEVLLQPLITIYQIVLLRSMVVGSQRRPKILTVEKIFNTSS